MPRALIVVDIQNDYFPGGANPLDRPEEAASQASRLLDAFRASGEHVVHVQHVWDEPDAPFMRPGTPGVEIHEAVAPQPARPCCRRRGPTRSATRAWRATCARAASTSSSSAG